MTANWFDAPLGGEEDILEFVEVMAARVSEYILKSTELHTSNGCVYVNYVVYLYKTIIDRMLQMLQI